MLQERVDDLFPLAADRSDAGNQGDADSAIDKLWNAKKPQGQA
jgi:hypothetical protein